MTAALHFAPRQQRIDAVLFDLDGTLLDSHLALEAVFWRFLDTHRIARSSVDIKHFDGLTIPEIVATLRHDWSLAAGENSLVGAYLDAVRSAYEGQVSPFAGADSLLRQLRAHGTKLALVTAAISPVLLPVLERLAWSELFDAVIPGDRVARGKPAPDGYVAALQALQVTPAQAIVVEDSRHGIAAARAAGLTVIGIAPSERAASLAAAGAAVVLPSVSAITSVLQHIEACDA